MKAWVLSTACFAVYTLSVVLTVKGSNPYNPGPYQTAEYVITPERDGSPLHSTVYYPTAKGTYTPILFIGGLGGYVLVEFYSTFLRELAAHGYIVMGMNPVDLDARPFNEGARNHNLKDFYLVRELDKERYAFRANNLERYFKQSEWLRDHFSGRTNASPDWSKSAMMCHSASCDDVLLIVNQSRTFVQAAVFLDPVSAHSVTMTPIVSKVTALTYMSQLSESPPNDCCIPGMGWKRIYDLMTCIKVRMEPQAFGHCDLLDSAPWEACHITKFCRTTDNKHLSNYRNFTAGVITAFLQWTIYGDVEMRKYVTVEQNMPLPLVDLAFNTSCSG